ncbi:phage major capsid protein [Sinorhizobium medicae]|uniref:phage major capsid protein n=1 Tax=Sinorhizobium medicae TaxID=110321 RepID=UPI00299D37CC|nr:phage major capsid protein [Sinorhizobium medicae]MDX0512749.1 phage major capsid protein [Sinorhizobium medicae]MDX0937371.1 phage major capsid protein [Sinorhizobium medicae]MDX0943522.1 phage major capsid protein [Sinorhizobium medicae]MDX0949020.1 phage major capsid protein [Sinorhizobium medicae]MDX1010709.1 phage major capsid protein [Sinorhizobium medicae]
MNIHKQPYHVKAAAVHLLDQSGFRTKNDGDPLEMLARKFGDHASEVMTKLGASNAELEGLKANLDELTQKMARGSHYYGGRSAESETMGAQFTDNPELKTFADYRTRPSRFSMEVKATVTTAADSAGAMGTAYRDATVQLPQRRMTVRSLLPTIRVTSGSVEYAQQITRTNNADMVAETLAKPESAYAWELKDLQMRVIAHWIPASRQVLDDLPQLRGLIDTELMYGLKLKEDEQLLNGSGTGQNLSGLVTNATPYAAPITIASPTSIDLIGLAILQNALALYPADGVIVNSADWMFMRLLKNSDGDYILGSPSVDVTKVLFGLPVVDTPAMTVDKFLVGNFQAAATLYDRWDARIEVSTEHADFFIKNMVAILCEERLGLAVKNPLALTYGDFGRVS